MFVILIKIQDIVSVSIWSSILEVSIGVAVYVLLLVILRDSFLCKNIKRMMGRFFLR